MGWYDSRFICDRAWGFNWLEVVNLFAYRATYPYELRSIADPIGRSNNMYSLEAARSADLFVCGWGNHGAGPRAESVRRRLNNYDLYHLGLTKSGEPKHPLYLPGNLEPVLWEAA